MGYAPCTSDWPGPWYLWKPSGRHCCRELTAKRGSADALLALLAFLAFLAPALLAGFLMPPLVVALRASCLPVEGSWAAPAGRALPPGQPPRRVAESPSCAPYRDWGRGPEGA